MGAFATCRSCSRPAGSDLPVESLAVIPFIVMHPSLGLHDRTTEYTEIVFYFALGGLTGWLFDRQRLSDEQRIKAERRLAQTERLGMLGRMVATVAHEVKNPLGSIRGSVEILSDEIPKEHARREFIDIIQAETERLEAIVDTYLEYGSPKPPQRRPGDLSALIRAQCEQVRATHAGIRLAQDIPERMPAEFDPGQLRRVLINLLNNAAEAMPNGGEITVKAGPERAAFVITIADHGAGIPAEVREHLFEPFVTSKASGSGLGLSLSREIVEAHGGQLELDLEPPVGVGSIFRITLPASGMQEAIR
jgi:signal transduction histidine kinase